MGDLRPAATNPFDSPLETGLRALVVLEAMYPRACDLKEMTWYDHLVVNTADVAGREGEEAPQSLHPAIPGRQDALIVRRDAVEKSLLLMHGSTSSRWSKTRTASGTRRARRRRASSTRSRPPTWCG